MTLAGIIFTSSRAITGFGIYFESGPIVFLGRSCYSGTTSTVISGLMPL